jgi:FkbM family methyltransferase
MPYKARHYDRIEQFDIVEGGHLLHFGVRPGTDDIDIIQDVQSNPYYRFARSLLQEDSVVIDVGAHIGSFTLLAAVRGARVLALEPVPSNYTSLVENVRLNNLQAQVKTLNRAAWSLAGKRTMRVTDETTGGSSLCYGKETAPEIPVHCVRLDELMDTERITICDLLKLDCEGAEFEILHTMNHAAWWRIQSIVLEYHLGAGHSLAQLQNLLAAQGFLIATRPLEGPLGLGYLLAVRPSIAPPLLQPMEVILTDSAVARLPVIGHVWHAIRRSAHNLVVFYLDQMISALNIRLMMLNSAERARLPSPTDGSADDIAAG